jgi:hypothetical protein
MVHDAYGPGERAWSPRVVGAPRRAAHGPLAEHDDVACRSARPREELRQSATSTRTPSDLMRVR